jgi:hypothetical protein
MRDDLERAQDRLFRTLERARASEDRELAGRVRDEGFQLVHQLNGLLRMSRLHSLDNRAFEKPLKESARSLLGLGELLGTLTLAVVEDQVYLNEIRIRLDGPQGGAVELGAELARHGLGGLRFHRAPGEAELRRFVACFAAKPDPRSPRAVLRAALQRDGLEGIELLGRFRARVAADAPAEGPGAPSAADALERCAQAVTDAFDNLGRGRLFNPLPARRAVTALLAAGAEREGLAADPPGCAPHVAHALRVCRLALLLGRGVGLPRGLLQDLGVAALLHDVGYAETDADGRRPGFDRHASAGARLLLRQRGFHPSKVRRVRAVLAHHAPAAEGRRRSPALLAQILRVAEDYDSLVRRGGLDPQQALGRMMGAAGAAYEASVVQAFVNALGARPPGARVTLTDGRSGVVVAPSRGERGFTRPVVAVDHAADGSRLASPVRVDLEASQIGLRGVPERPAPPPVSSPPLIELPDELTLVEPSSPAPVPPPSPKPDRTARGAAALLEGTLSQGVPIRLIHDARLEHRSGRLTFESDEERIALHFVDGDVVGVSSSRPEHSLAALLLGGGLVSPHKLEEAAREAEEAGRPLGRTLRERGLLDPEALEQALSAQARVLVSNLVEWEDGRYRFVPDEGPQPEEDEGHAISTDGLIVGAVRALHDPDVVRFALGDIDRVLARRADPARRAAAEILGPAERSLLDRVEGRTSARVVLKEAGLPAAEAQRALLTLLALGLVDYPPAAAA